MFQTVRCTEVPALLGEKSEKLGWGEHLALDQLSKEEGSCPEPFKQLYKDSRLLTLDPGIGLGMG